MEVENKRLLLEINTAIREINRTTIDPQIPKLSVDDLNPAMKMLAHTRAPYLKKLFDMGNSNQGEIPSEQQIGELRKLRLAFEEMTQGAQALEVAINRGYLEVLSKRSSR